MDERAAWELEMRRVYLSVTDVMCPRCGYNLRGSPGDKCPECAAPVEFGIKGEPAKSGWDTVAVVGFVLTTIYFVVHGAWQVVWLLDMRGGGMGMLTFMRGAALGAITTLLMAMLGTCWCVGMYVTRKRRPRPLWARPTNAAAGLLLAVFVTFLLGYGMRWLI